MSEDRLKRMLAAILSADVKGYSRLMAQDEVATIRTLTTYREVMTGLIEKHHGRVVDAPGDNLLAEFASVVNAVTCAVDIQRELAQRNEEFPADRKMEFRIGINLGDVIQEGERIYGDGVNIAARLEGQADAGGICISGTAYDQVRNKLKLGYESLGQLRVKNIDAPVRAYRVLIAPEEEGVVTGEGGLRLRRSIWVVLVVVLAIVLVGVAVATYQLYLRPGGLKSEVASKEMMAFPLPDRPSIAVLPFNNLSGNPQQEYLSDGITESIINALSKIQEIFVIARNSTFTYKGKPVNFQQISKELGVRHVLEGSIKTSGGQVRVSAQLVEATTGLRLWSEQYDRELKDIFSLQDEITHQIVVALQVELTEGEQARVRNRSTSNLKAWGYAVKAYSYFERYTKEGNARARELFQDAVNLDPEYAWAWTYLGWTHWIDARFEYSVSREESFNKAVEMAQKALSLDESNPDIHALLGVIYLFQRKYEQALAEGEKAIALGPNSAENHAILAMTKYYVGSWEDAIALNEKAMRLSPYYPSWFLLYMGDAYGFLGMHEKAIATLEKLVERRRRSGEALIGPLIGLTWNYALSGQVEEAQARAAELLRINPSFTLEYVHKENFFKNPAHLERILDALRETGLPEQAAVSSPEKP